MTQLLVWLNATANLLGQWLLAPIGMLPGWLSNTLVAAAAGVAMLPVFKVTSNQQAIRRTRNRIKANLLALSLFRDDFRVALKSQWGLVRGAASLLALALVPMAVMLVPVSLLVSQLALWYQARPLAVGEESVVAVRLNDPAGEFIASAQLHAPPGVRIEAGPVRIPDRQIVCWSFTALEAGTHRLQVEVGGHKVSKQLAVGDGFRPTSLKRPAWNVWEVMLHPREQPLSPAHPVQSIEIDFPRRSGWASGSDGWLIYFFVVSLTAAFAARPLFRVHL